MLTVSEEIKKGRKRTFICDVLDLKEDKMGGTKELAATVQGIRMGVWIWRRGGIGEN